MILSRTRTARELGRLRRRQRNRAPRGRGSRGGEEPALTRRRVNSRGQKLGQRSRVRVSSMSSVSSNPVISVRWWYPRKQRRKEEASRKGELLVLGSLVLQTWGSLGVAWAEAGSFGLRAEPASSRGDELAGEQPRRAKASERNKEYFQDTALPPMPMRVFPVLETSLLAMGSRS